MKLLFFWFDILLNKHKVKIDDALSNQRYCFQLLLFFAIS